MHWWRKSKIWLSGVAFEVCLYMAARRAGEADRWKRRSIRFMATFFALTLPVTLTVNDARAHSPEGRLRCPCIETEAF